MGHVHPDTWLLVVDRLHQVVAAPRTRARAHHPATSSRPMRRVVRRVDPSRRHAGGGTVLEAQDSGANRRLFPSGPSSILITTQTALVTSARAPEARLCGRLSSPCARVPQAKKRLGRYSAIAFNYKILQYHLDGGSSKNESSEVRPHARNITLMHIMRIPVLLRVMMSPPPLSGTERAQRVSEA